MKAIVWTILDVCRDETHPEENKLLTFVCKSGRHRPRIDDFCIGEYVAPGGDMVSYDSRGIVIDVIEGGCVWGTFFCQHGFMDWEDVFCWRYTDKKPPEFPLVTISVLEDFICQHGT